MKMKIFMNAIMPFIVILLFGSGSFGQSTDTLKYNINFQIGGQRKRGAFSQTSIKARVNIKFENEKLVFNNQSSYTYTEANGFNIADDWHLRTIGMFKLNSTSRCLPLFGHNYLKNVLYRILNGNRTFTGVRIIPVKQYDFSFTLGAGYEFTSYANETFINSTQVSNQRDFSFGFFNLLGKHNLGKHKIIFEYNLSLVQSFEEANEFAFWTTSSISVPFGKHLSLGVNYDFRYRNVHLVDLPKINDLLLFNLRFNFSN